MTTTKHHDKILKELNAEYKELFEASPQAIYAYMDDHHIIWNKKFSELTGYKTPSEVRKTNRTFLDLFVHEKSHKTLATAYMKAVEHGKGSSVNVQWKNKNGKTRKANTILVPIPFQGHVIALHFIE